MTLYTNAWITVEKNRALTWRDYELWRRDPELYTQPTEISAWEKKAVRRVSDMGHLFKAFLRPEILTKQWIMLSVYEISAADIASGYNQLGDAETGGDFGCAGFWEWEAGWSFCRFVPLYAWRPNQVLLFMPPTYTQEGVEVPATGVRDVNVAFGQPPREFPI